MEQYGQLYPYGIQIGDSIASGNAKKHYFNFGALLPVFSSKYDTITVSYFYNSIMHFVNTNM